MMTLVYAMVDETRAAGGSFWSTPAAAAVGTEDAPAGQKQS